MTARVTALTDARTEAEKALQTAQASAAEQKLALEQERQRGDALVRELASARELVAESVQNGVAVSRIEAGQAVQVTNASSQAGSVSPSTTRSVLVKRAAPDGPGSASDPQHTAADSVGKGHSAATSAREPQNAALGDPTRVAAPPPRAIGEHQIALWVKRGEEFTAAGDFVSARLVFQRAAETGNAKAAFMLAGTYDPAVLDRIRAMGVAPDIAKARLWYEKAKNSRFTRSGAKARTASSTEEIEARMRRRVHFDFCSDEWFGVSLCAVGEYVDVFVGCAAE